MPVGFGITAMGSKSVRTFIVDENCEGTGTPSGWTNTTGTPNWDYATVPLEGAQSLYLSLNGAGHRSRTDFTNVTEAWLYFLVRLTNGTAPSAASTMAAFSANGVATNTNLLDLNASLQLRLGAIHTVSALALDTTYHVWFHFMQGSGADSVIDAAFSSNGIRPTSGNAFTQNVAGTGTNLVGRLWIGTTVTTMGVDIIYDKIRVAATQIGDNGS